MMNRPQRQQPSQNVSTRLPMLSSLPGPSDLANLLGEVQKNGGKVFHLPWIVEAKGLLYDLACGFTQGQMDAEWTLSAGSVNGGLSTSTIWAHSSPDMDLILNLCLMECETVSTGGDKDAQTSLSELKALVSEDIAKQQQGGYVPPRPGGPPAYPRPEPQAPAAPKPRPMSLSSPMPNSMPQAGGADAPSTSQTVAAVQYGALPLSAPPDMSRPGAMMGRLSDTPSNNLLQSLALALVTGRLRVRDQNSVIELFFEQGMLAHATSREGDGEVAVLDMLALTQGDFEFFPDERSPERTITRRIDSIVVDCMTLVHNQQYLENAGLKVSSYLTRKNLSLTETEFDNQTRAAHSTNREMLKSLYQQIDQHSSFLELLRKFPVSKLDWLPALYTLVTAGLVEIADRPSQDGKSVDLASVGVDLALVQSAYQSILRPDTGLMSFPLLLHFLEQEFYRYERSRLPFTLMVFSVAKTTGQGLLPLDDRESRRLAQAVDRVKRKIDILGHFQGADYAMILPCTNVAGAKIFANRLMETVCKGGVCDVAPPLINFACGLASLPEDSLKVELLLPAAMEAKKKASATSRGVVAFKSPGKS